AYREARDQGPSPAGSMDPDGCEIARKPVAPLFWQDTALPRREENGSGASPRNRSRRTVSGGGAGIPPGRSRKIGRSWPRRPPQASEASRGIPFALLGRQLMIIILGRA